MSLAIVLTVVAGCTNTSAQAGSHVGFWRMTSDEDNGPLGEIFEFRASGEYVYYDRECKPFPALRYHLYDGDVYVTNTIPQKGPVAVVFHPEPDGRLSYTSPRTHNRAWYERVAEGKCVRPAA